MPTADTLIARLRPVLFAGPRLRLAVLFGSFAAGRERPGSDVDLAILPADPGLPLRDELMLAGDLSRALGREIDLVRLDRASAALRWQIARQGIPVHADPTSELVRFRVAAALEHADMADALATASALYRRHLAESSA